MFLKMKYFFFILVFLPLSKQEAIVINEENIDQLRTSKDIMLLNFYADWCRYSAALKPIFDQAADAVHSETNKAVLGKVNCEEQKFLCQQKYHINKYPTLKIIRNGELMRKEFRGQRSVEALAGFIRKELRDPITFVDSYTKIYDEIKDNVKGVIGRYPSNSSEEFETFSKAAFSLKDDCKFFVVLNPNEQNTLVTFRETSFPDVDYNGNMLSEGELKNWLSEKCIPLVREVTFENGEELTEEGLPFLILFYHPDHTDTKNTFRTKVEEELIHEKGNINFVTADGVRFAHPLSHLGKSKKDLPLIAIDSFKHMYVFPNYEDINVPGKLKEFIEDLHSGKLHKDFHNSPESHPHKHHVQARNAGEQPQAPNHGTQQPTPGNGRGASVPPDSSFKKLQPADSRYTLLTDHDEL